MSLIFLIACSSDIENGPKEKTYRDLTGLYRTTGDVGQIETLTSLEVLNGNSENDVKVHAFRNGLSYDERYYFDSYGLLQWADTEFGRELRFNTKREDLDSRNFMTEDGQGRLVVCTEKTSVDDQSLDFQYCIDLIKESEEDQKAQVKLTLITFEFGEAINRIELDYSVFIKDRLAVDYFGNWSGEIAKEGGYYYDLELASGSDLFITFQPLNETDYIVRPQDVNQVIRLNDEVFVLEPINRPISELESSANPYINFRYVSEQNGNRVIYYNSTVIRQGRIEGNVELINQFEESEILATYYLEKD